KYAADVKAVGIERWAKELQARNEAFGKLIKDRFDETALKSDVKVKEARALLDESYKGMVEMINALALVEGEDVYVPFMRGLNVVIEKYALALARRGKKK
ncbi:MAG: DUF6261 family protein, partial [Clostridiales bacterium]|nr:DUF6261 family protein [Clostridiales bacterium]